MPLTFFDHGSHVEARHIPDAGKVDRIPPSVYRIRPTKEGLDLIRDRKRFNLPSKIYGKHHSNLKVIMETFEENAGTTGVILKGLKGAGKSLLAENIGNKCLDLEMPVLLITEEIPAAMLKAVIQLIGSCMVYFDEYGKIYSKDTRGQMLTLFSDSDLKNVMFVVTANEDKELNEYMIDRPSRFMFNIEYGDLSSQVVEEVCTHLDIIPELRDYLVAYAAVRSVSFDILMYLARQAQRAQSVKEFNQRLEILNVPDPVYLTTNVVDVAYKGKAFIGEVAVRDVDGTMEMDLIEDGSLAMVGSFTYDAKREGKVLISKNTMTSKYRVQFNEDVVMTITHSWGGSVGHGFTRKLKAKIDKDGNGSLEPE